jgi:hypothetical protein
MIRFGQCRLVPVWGDNGERKRVRHQLLYAYRMRPDPDTLFALYRGKMARSVQASYTVMHKPLSRWRASIRRC